MKIAEVDLLKESTYQTPCGTIHYWSSILSLDTTTLVFLPGLTADHRLFDKQVAYFDGKYNIIVWDAPAHASSWPFRFEFDLFDKAKWLNGILEKEEIIEGYEVRINQLKLGYHITAFINLEVAPVQKQEFYPFIKSCPNVVECNCVTGNYSMLLKVMFPSTMELDTFIGQLQKFGRTSTQIVFSTPVAPRGIDVNQEMPTDN